MHNTTLVSLLLKAWCVFWLVDPLLSQSQCSNEENLVEKCIRTEVKTEQLEKRVQALEAKQTADRAVLMDEISKCALSNIELKSKHALEILDLKRDMSEIGMKLRQDPVIAFSAYNPSTLSLGDGPTIVYKETLLNEGSGYDPVIGVITAPAAGLYLFTAHTCNKDTKYAIVAIVHENSRIAIDTQYDLQSSCGSVSALLHVAVGEIVHVESAYTDTAMRTDQYRRSSFLGARLHSG